MHDEQATILLIEDDPAIHRLVIDSLAAAGYLCKTAADGRSGLDEAGGVALVILDIGLPGIDGFEVARRLRVTNRSLPIIVVSARGGEEDKLLAFEIGADDYVVKPFSGRELAARVAAVLRRLNALKGDPKGDRILTRGDLELDTDQMVARRRDTVLDLTPTEFCMLRYFMCNPKIVIANEIIISDVLGYSPDSYTALVKVHISRLRKKIEDDAGNPTLIRTVPRFGYMFWPTDGD